MGIIQSICFCLTQPNTRWHRPETAVATCHMSLCQGEQQWTSSGQSGQELSLKELNTALQLLTLLTLSSI